MTEDLEGLKGRLVVGHKRDGRNVYDEQAKAELVALCLRPGASVSRLAREFSVNANQVTRWLREHGHGRRPRSSIAPVVAPPPSAFMEMPVVHPGAAPGSDAALHLHARLPNGVAIELRNIDLRKVGDVIDALGRLRCSVSTKG